MLRPRQGSFAPKEVRLGLWVLHVRIEGWMRMDVRALKWFFAVVVGFSSAVFAGPVNIYHSSFDLLIPSPDDPNSQFGRGWMADAVIDVPDSFLIQDVDVVVALTHESFFDLEIILQSPTGTNVLLNPAGNLAFLVEDGSGGFTPVGGSIDMFFDDEADLSIEQAAEPFVGPYRPVWGLSDFDGQNANGLWRLRINDWWQGDTGSLQRVELMITVPEPATALPLLIGAFLLRLRKRYHLHPDKQPGFQDYRRCVN